MGGVFLGGNEPMRRRLTAAEANESLFMEAFASLFYRLRTRAAYENAQAFYDAANECSSASLFSGETWDALEQLGL